MINSIDPSPFDAGTAYVAGTMYKSDDFRPYLYKTSDYGATWTKITSGIANEHFTRVVRTDKRRKGLLYAGTERGMYISFDDGANWQSLQLNLPIVPITDLALRDDDLIAATQGRGFWILDDVTPLQQWAAESGRPSTKLFPPRDAWRMGGSTPEKPPQRAGKNPPQGIVVNYWLDPAIKAGTPVKLAFLANDGSVIREFTGVTGSQPVEEKEKKEESEEDEKARKEREKNKLPDSKAGFNRFAWNLRYPEAKKFEGLILWGGGTDGPRIVPGTYTVRLTVGEETRTATAQLKQDPRTTASQADLQSQFDYLMAANRKLTEVHEQIERIREVRKQLTDLRTRAGKGDSAKPLVDATKALDEKMKKIEETLYQTKNRSPQDPLNYPIRLNDKLASVAESASMGDFAPTAQQRAVYAQLIQQIDTQLAQLRALWATDLPALNALVKQSEIPAIR